MWKKNAICKQKTKQHPRQKNTTHNHTQHIHNTQENNTINKNNAYTRTQKRIMYMKKISMQEKKHACIRKQKPPTYERSMRMHTKHAAYIHNHSTCIQRNVISIHKQRLHTKQIHSHMTKAACGQRKRLHVYKKKKKRYADKHYNAACKHKQNACR